MGCGFTKLGGSGGSNTNKKYVSIPVNRLNIPLIRWQVATAHNAYLRDVQHLVAASADNVRDAIRTGARYILLDVYRVNGQLVCAHGYKNVPTTTPTPFAECLDVLLEHGFQGTTDPLLLNVELCLDRKYWPDVNAMLEQRLGNRLTQRKDFALTPQYNRLWDVPIGMLANRITLISDELDVGANRFFPVDDSYNTSSSTYAEGGANWNPRGKWFSIWNSNIEQGLGTNYNPLPMLQRGFQSIAMNVLVDDTGMAAYKGWFNGAGFHLSPAV